MWYSGFNCEKWFFCFLNVLLDFRNIYCLYSPLIFIKAGYQGLITMLSNACNISYLMLFFKNKTDAFQLALGVIWTPFLVPFSNISFVLIEFLLFFFPYSYKASLLGELNVWIQVHRCLNTSTSIMFLWLGDLHQATWDWLVSWGAYSSRLMHW